MFKVLYFAIVAAAVSRSVHAFSLGPNSRHDSSSNNIPYGPKQQPWSDIPLPAGATVTGPKRDPNQVYVSVPPDDVKGDFPKIDYRNFEVPPTGLTEEERAVALDSFKDFVETQRSKFAGFQGNQDQSYQGTFSYLLDMHANNIGDPFQSGRYTLNSKFCERAVLDWFAALWNIDWPHNKNVRESYWGYVLTMGFTEGNIYSVYNARDYLKGRVLLNEPQSEDHVNECMSRGKEVPDRQLRFAEPLIEDRGRTTNQYTPILFYSEDVHYSVTKAGHIVGVETFAEIGSREYPGECPINGGTWPKQVPCHNYDNANPLSGSVKVDDLEKLVRFFVNKDYPVVVVANVGTTWKGAYDDVPAINDMLVRLGTEYPWLWKRRIRYRNDDGTMGQDYRRGFWLMVDGALGGPFLPFIEMAHKQGHPSVKEAGPIFDFRNDAVMSVGCSMHKWIGAPWPSGIFMTRTCYQLQPPDAAEEFLGTPDTTLGGSRSAFSPMIFWDYISRMSYDDNIEKAVETLTMAKYLEEKLKGLECTLKQKFGPSVDLWIARSSLSLTVRFRLVNEDLNYKYSIDTDTYLVPVVDQSASEKRSYSHIFAMHSLTKALVDEFISDVLDSAQDDWHNAFPMQNTTDTTPKMPPVRYGGKATAGEKIKSVKRPLSYADAVRKGLDPEAGADMA